jgi:SAM-dependent methyltransferase
MNWLMLLEHGDELRLKLLEALPPLREADIVRLRTAGGAARWWLCRDGERLSIEPAPAAAPIGVEVMGAVTALERGRVVLSVERGVGRLLRPRHWSATLAALEVVRRFRHPWTPPLFQGPAEALLAGVRDKYDQPIEAAQYGRFATGELTAIERELVERHVPRGGRILDIGCGGGREAVGLGRLGYRVVGIDVAPRMVDAARVSAARLSVPAEFRQQSVTTLDEPPGAYDAAFFGGSLSHVPGRALRIQTLVRVRGALTTSGVLILMVDYRAPRPLLSRSRVVDAVRRVARSLGRARRVSEPGDGYLREVSQGSDPERACFFHHYAGAAEIRAELQAAGFDAEEASRGFWVCRPTRALC